MTFLGAVIFFGFFFAGNAIAPRLKEKDAFILGWILALIAISIIQNVVG